VSRGLFVPISERLRYRKPGEPLVILHGPDDASVRRAALLRIWDLGHRLAFEEHEHVPSQTLRVRSGTRVYSGNEAAAELARVLPAFLWMRWIRWLPSIGAVARVILRQRA
jgi:hypothetical protein